MASHNCEGAGGITPWARKDCAKCNPVRIDVNKIVEYELGELGEEETIELFQTLIDTGAAWTMQGSYGRTAVALIEAGHCHG